MSGSELLHTDRTYDAELKHLRELLLTMGAHVEQMIGGAVGALLAREASQAHAMIDRDHEVNRLEREIDEHCLRMLARRQPVASDLRFITIALKLVTDLERIGDSAVNISERAIAICQEPPGPPMADIGRMAEGVRAMVREGLDAFVAESPERAARLIEQDRGVDAYYGQIFRDLLAAMTRDPTVIPRAMALLSVAKHLERIGDHVTNLAEMVVFLVQGRDIRHQRQREPESGAAR